MLENLIALEEGGTPDLACLKVESRGKEQEKTRIVNGEMFYLNFFFCGGVRVFFVLLLCFKR